MPYASFHAICPEIAEAETRSLTLTQPQNSLPAQTYTFLELYCNEPKCDCRRVFFSVVGSHRNDILATIAYGWESRKFYVKWFGMDEPLTIDSLLGPCLDIGNPQSSLAPQLLAMCKELLLADPAYVARIKRHYNSFREQIGHHVRRKGHNKFFPPKAPKFLTRN